MTPAAVAAATIAAVGQPVTWTHAGDSATIIALYDPGYGTPLDRRADPDGPSLIAVYSEFDGNLCPGDVFGIEGQEYEACGPLIIDAPTDEVIIYLRPLYNPGG